MVDPFINTAEIKVLFSTDSFKINEHYQKIADDVFYKVAADKIYFLTETQKKDLKKTIKISIAEQINRYLKTRHKELASILVDSLTHSHSINIENIRKRCYYKNPKPKAPLFLNEPPKPILLVIYKILAALFPSKRKEYSEKIELWEKENDRVIWGNIKLEKIFEQEVEEWSTKNNEYQKHIESLIDSILLINQGQGCRDLNAIDLYFKQILFDSKYLEEDLYTQIFNKEFDLFYNEENKMLVIDYSLPSSNDLMKLREIKYIQTRDIFEPKLRSAPDYNRLYDNILYQLTLRTIFELFDSDASHLIEIVTFNGWITSLNPATGQNQTVCVLSVQVNKSEFKNIDLKHVDPKTCFKGLKGIGSSKLHSITPIAPIVQIEKEDKRFILSYDVAKKLNEGDNLAIMDWKDFEQLVREIFEQEFTKEGGKVKVTRASRDGGVDAVAFDPDPLRGGKIVIQAKRYTNVVGVSAVRDLYGTVMNEGANKGILVTTSNYGTDAYEFAKGKPLVLLDGNNLLHLLQKHGHRARIDLQEAKLMMAELEAETKKNDI